MRNRILVLFSFESEDPEVDNDPWCIQLGKYDDATEGMIQFLKECTLKSHMTLKLEGKEETFPVTADFVMSCLQDLNDMCWNTVITSGRTVMLKSCNYPELQPGKEDYFCKETGRKETWYPRTIYCESQHLSFAKTNVPFAAMLYNAKKMRKAKANEVQTILTYLCCFMEADAAWEKRKHERSKKSLNGKVNRAIKEMVDKSKEKIEELKPSELRRSMI